MSLMLGSTLGNAVHDYPVATERWTLFVYGLTAALVVFLGSGLRRVKTIIHEMKHAVVVLLSGNEVDEFRADRDSGHVIYSLYEGKTHFAPFITLAPYYFPLLSLPVLVAAILAEYFGAADQVQLALCLLLGITLGTDVSTAYLELHPGQSDLQKILGGSLVILVFLAAAHLSWILLSLLWIQSGAVGLQLLGHAIVSLGVMILPMIRR